MHNRGAGRRRYCTGTFVSCRTREVQMSCVGQDDADGIASLEADFFNLDRQAVPAINIGRASSMLANLLRGRQEGRRVKQFSFIWSGPRCPMKQAHVSRRASRLGNLGLWKGLVGMSYVSSRIAVGRRRNGRNGNGSSARRPHVQLVFLECHVTRQQCGHVKATGPGHKEIEQTWGSFGLSNFILD